MALDILVLLLIVALIFQRLWKVLGTGADNQPQKIKLSREGAEKLFNILKAESEKELKRTAENFVADGGEIAPNDLAQFSELDQVLLSIPQFNRENFIKSAKKAFRIITDAFNEGDFETVKLLLHPNLAPKFKEVIDQRKADKLTAETDFVGFDKVTIVDAKVEKGMAYITVEFVSEQTNVLRNEQGEVVQGDENYIQTITDVWTFTKVLDPVFTSWLLKSTKKHA